MFTVCTILYGDFPEYADRCLASIAEMKKTTPGLIHSVRVGLNEISARTAQIVNDHIDLGTVRRQDTFDPGRNANKYPLMRHMFYGRPIETPYVMWFDDDSFVIDPNIASICEQLLQHPKTVLVGREYQYRRLSPTQVKWVSSQTWYTGRPMYLRQPFLPGAWWAANMQYLVELDFPWEDLNHNGGDIALSLAVLQQGMKWESVPHGSVGFNASIETPGRESTAVRRGTKALRHGYPQPRPQVVTETKVLDARHP